MIKEIIVFVIVILLALIFSKIYSNRQYIEGYTTGCLVSLLWVQNNTNCKDAIETYILVESQHPEDGIYICKKKRNGKVKLGRKAKTVHLSRN